MQTKTKIIQNIINNPETQNTVEYWDDLCENGQFESAKQSISVTALCAQLNSIAETHFDLLKQKKEIEKRNRSESVLQGVATTINNKIVSKIQKWNEDIKSKSEIFICDEILSISTVINLTNFVDKICKFKN